MIIIYEGKGCFRGKVFQVGNIGELTHVDIQFFIDSLKDVLASFIPKISVVVPITNALRKGVNSHKESLTGTVLGVADGEI